MTSTSRSFSCWILVFLSFDRFRSIVHPFKGKFSKRRYLTILIIAVLVLFFYYLTWDLRSKYTPLSQGGIVFSEFLLVSIMETVVPTALMYWFYRRISRKIQSDMMQSTMPGYNGPSLKRKLKAMYILKLLIAVYIFSIVPGRIYIPIDQLLFNSLDVSISMTTRRHALSAAHFLLYVNNRVNVFIYIYLMDDFRRFLIKTFTCNLLKKENL